jgi:hypothetical protein
MNSSVVIARREIVDKKFVLAAAVAFAVIPFLLPLLPGSAHKGVGKDTIVVAAGIFAMGFAGGLAAILGASFIGRDVSEGRMSFYFARPLSSSAIYFGKLAAALLLILLSFAIILGPAVAFAPANFFKVWTGSARVMTTLVLVVSFGLFLVSHVIGTFVRSRSALVAVDFVLAVLVGIGVWMVLRPLLDAMSWQVAGWVGRGLAFGAALAIVAGGAWQLARGRIDRKRHHIELSKFLWPALGVVLAIGAGYVAWVVNASPKELRDFQAEAGPGGRFAIVAGPAAHRGDYQPVFLIDASNGGYTKIAAGWRWGAEFTRDGSKLLVARAVSPSSGEADLAVRDLAAGTERDTGLTLPGGSIVTNDDGSRIATVAGNVVAAYDVAAKRSLASVRLTEHTFLAALFFDGPDHLRMYEQDGGLLRNVTMLRRITIREVDLRTREVRPIGAFEASARWLGMALNTDGSLMRVRIMDGDSAIVVADGRTGAVISKLAPVPGASFSGGIFLQDGGIVVGEIAGGQATLRVFNADASPRAAIPLGASRAVFPLREMVPGKIVAGLGDPQKTWKATVVDLATGKVTAQNPARPLVGAEFGSGTYDSRARLVGPALLLRDGKQLVQWNAVTGEKKVLLGM